MKQYTLFSDEAGGIPFTLFSSFFQAMKTLEAPISRHHSQICFRFIDGIETTYIIGEDPTSTGGSMTRRNVTSHCDIFTCIERPGLSVRVDNRTTKIQKRSRLDPRDPSKTNRENTFKQLIGTELSEHWSYKTDHGTYHLSKVARGKTKHYASYAIPTFGISIDSANPDCIHDLFGRFEHGREIPLSIVCA